MSGFEYWRLCDQLTLVQAALLMAGHDPSGIEYEVEGMGARSQPAGYAACRQALIGAIDSKRLAGWLSYDEGCDINGNPYSRLNAQRSEVKTFGIAGWLVEKGVQLNFFLPTAEAPKEYLDPEHERFAPKLAAAIKAWEAVGEDTSPKGTPKQRIEKWLRLHAAEYGLTQKDGKPNESAINAISKIANWNLEGGAPATPASSATSAPKNRAGAGQVISLKKHAVAAAAHSFELDDDIPF